MSFRPIYDAVDQLGWIKDARSAANRFKQSLSKVPVPNYDMDPEVCKRIVKVLEDMSESIEQDPSRFFDTMRESSFSTTLADLIEDIKPISSTNTTPLEQGATTFDNAANGDQETIYLRWSTQIEFNDTEGINATIGVQAPSGATMPRGFESQKFRKTKATGGVVGLNLVGGINLPTTAHPATVMNPAPRPEAMIPSQAIVVGMTLVAVAVATTALFRK
ncbi:hypothetical protein MSAN_00841300 [Mycena sanguinolenta]|uniref:Uncharacterized protein n=1 Tax=Mycena sanguinolenta TaxID=230812 RepID=A0A8H6YYZ4_9AGAR|nr:hypothetical protein MSAN_00841300 [Mycena sanguinolenta]